MYQIIKKSPETAHIQLLY